jgi:hypothetical protein
MKTRSGKTYSNPISTLDTSQTTLTPVEPQIQNGVYEVNIDFDDASREWLQNKRKLRDCTYVYKCMYVTRSNRQCTGKAIPNSCYCMYHAKA